MNMLRAGLVVLACVATPIAFAQWQWVDPSGRKVFSDQPPPPGTPPDKILKQPGNRPVEADPQPAASAPAGAMPRISGRDKVLDEKRKAVQNAEAEKQKAQEMQAAHDTAENCQRAKESKATLAGGGRMSRVNANGEREYLDDAAVAAERQRLEQVIKRDCPH
ncbi:MAG TPA: DUF4124 domain-containing protein [Ramlibacter sp.]|jgi:type IV secretory pathway VirB10-like protein